MTLGWEKVEIMLDFVMEQQGIEDVSHALQILSDKVATISPANSFSFRRQETLSAYEDIRILSLENPLLIQYLQERKIHFAGQLCKEVHYQRLQREVLLFG
ncbi:hypothetical protein EZS27_007526 [termite gut metagenome]|uniref:Uncharacterized protein n=1 Tax=termite gut metagenome TaxID=433724 RepID=A0A5J4SI06_9ZZZZ